MLACLEQVTREGFQHPFSRAMVDRWARRVARYSFSVYSAETMQAG